MRYLVGVLITIGLVILVIVVIVRLVFSGGSGTSGPKSTVKPLIDYANTNVTMQITIEGSVQADQAYREVVVNVGQTQSYMDVLQGYENNLINSVTYNNNEASYANFLRALDFAGFRLGNTDPKLADERGYCALGQRYVVEIVQNGQDLQRYWTTSCGGTRTFLGNWPTVQALFIRQIPSYNALLSGVNLN